MNDPVGPRLAAPASVLDLTLRDALELLASAEPAPGGGAAAALAGALGAALVQMTANLTLGRPRYADVQEQARHLELEAGQLRRRLQRLADADAVAYAAVSAAYRLPRADDAQREARARAIQQALVGAAGVPLEVADTCAALLRICLAAAPVLNLGVISDVMVGALLARAALEAAAVNVEINVASIVDPGTAEPLAQALVQAREGTAQALQQVLEAADSRLSRRNRG